MQVKVECGITQQAGSVDTNAIGLEYGAKWERTKSCMVRICCDFYCIGFIVSQLELYFSPVTYIDLSNNLLEGTIPPELGYVLRIIVTRLLFTD